MSLPDGRDEGGGDAGDSALFTRDGHALGLALERLVAGELDGSAALRLGEHLAACPPCEARRAELDAPMPVPLGPPARRVGASPAEIAPPPAVPAQPVELLQPANAAGQAVTPDAVDPSSPGRGTSGHVGQRAPSDPPRPLRVSTAPGVAVSWRRAGAWATAAALAASAWIVTRPAAPERPEFHLRGGGLGLEVFRQTAGASEPLVDGSAARTGDTLGFRVQVRRDGYALVAGVDGQGAVYPVWPAAPPHEAVPVEASADARALDAAIRLDAAPGDERMVLVFCEAAFRLDGIREAVAAGGALPKGCAQRTVRLTKAGDP